MNFISAGTLKVQAVAAVACKSRLTGEARIIAGHPKLKLNSVV
jgi:hypothetical protein